MDSPDKIVFIAEAPVGNEAVDQLTKFDRALRDFGASGAGRGRCCEGEVQSARANTTLDERSSVEWNELKTGSTCKHIIYYSAHCST